MGRISTGRGGWACLMSRMFKGFSSAGSDFSRSARQVAQGHCSRRKLHASRCVTPSSQAITRESPSDLSDIGNGVLALDMIGSRISRAGLQKKRVLVHHRIPTEEIRQIPNLAKRAFAVKIVQLLTLMVSFLFVVRAQADERLKGIACRSVHLFYPAAKGTAFYNEVTVRQSAPGTYFMVCGWDKGYFGIQELGNGKKLMLFSVWDSNQNNPKAVKVENRTKLLHKDEAVRIGRFGGEGTGGQAFFDYDWKIGETYRLMVAAKTEGERTEYAGYFFVPETKQWKHLVTFSTITGGRLLGGYYSFVEDFKRDRISTTKIRKADYGNGWVLDADGKWQPLARARFTADRNPVLNINAGVADGRFFLATGGETQNTDTKLREFIELPQDDNSNPPADLPTNAKSQSTTKDS